MWKIQGTESQGQYVFARVIGHPKADSRGRVLLHRVLVENSIQRILDDDEIVHHNNGDQRDNRIENLTLMSRGSHSILHNEKAPKIIVICPVCKKQFQRRESKIKGQKCFCSKACSAKYNVPRRSPKKIEHGTYGRYRKGCRCKRCRSANSDRVRLERERKRVRCGML